MGGRADQVDLEDARSGPSDLGRPGARDAPGQDAGALGRSRTPTYARPPQLRPRPSASPTTWNREAAACLIMTGYLYFCVIGARLL